NGKKTRFIQQAVITLGLDNVSVVHARVEAWQMEQKFAVIISRAFSSLDAFVSTTKDKLSEQGFCYAMKGQYPSQEVEALDASFQLEASYILNVPELNAERHLLKIAHNIAHKSGS
ncbi:MAG TPA: 16S rRNA (guanine(527)-N(7))-methyltransferase RsmG, partial [Thiothrix sp.]|nr:16S rRNA (guanine(527)-N(7))-methyltransferase RsmG [Thiothrix sp.]